MSTLRVSDAKSAASTVLSPRLQTRRDELGRLWASCGVASEWSRLEWILLHTPGFEVDVDDAGAALFLDRIDAARAAAEHDALVATYRDAGVAVSFVEPPPHAAPPNLMFVADLLFLTPEGAILARPASNVRAGEERWVARRLAELGVPIVRSVGGSGVFEGADAQWLDERTVLLGQGPRTNAEGAAQVASALREQGVDVVHTNLPPGTMHLMGQVRFLDHGLAVVRRGLVDDAALSALRAHGYAVEELPEGIEMDSGMAYNFVTLGPREVVMPAGRTETQRFLEARGVRCHTVVVDEIIKAAGGIGCLTGVLRRALT